MSKKKNDKKIIILEPKFREVLVCRDAKIKPFIEIFISEPENVYQENLGKIAGVFEVTDFSEDSSYVVNYLISIIKKEYFSHPKRGAVESFEAALHKANLALSKLASHGSISWIGRLNAVCAAFEKNNLHISQTGTASALLIRSGMLTNISEGGEEQENPNPLKTFQDVLSGRMEKDDKLILTTDGIFEIFSLEEIKKSALRFSEKKFAQFLNTALVNELERSAALIVDIFEKEEPKIAPLPKISPVNVFSQTAFQKTTPVRAKEIQEEKREMIEEIKEEFQKTKDGFIDEKTGHIYIKDGDISYEHLTERKEYFSASREKIASGFSAFWSFLKSAAISGLKKLRLKKPLVSEEKIPGSDTSDMPVIPATEDVRSSAQEKIIIKEETEKVSLFLRLNPLPALKKSGVILAAFFVMSKNFAVSKIFVPFLSSIRNLGKNLLQKYKRQVPSEKSIQQESFTIGEKNVFEEKQPVFEEKKQLPENFPEIDGKLRDFWSGRMTYQEKSESKRWPSFSEILPSFSRIKNMLKIFSLKQKIYATLFVLAILVIPYFIAKHKEGKKEDVPTQKEEQKIIVPLEQDKNVVRVENLNSAYQGTNILSPVNINANNFTIVSNEIVSINDNKNYPFPENFANPDLISQMDDLNLIFIIKNERIVSFSATARKFQDNNISIPENANIVSARSYLTYLYILDSKNSQIYRYPRAEGGFGEKTNWLKDTVDFSGTKDMAINENIYIADEKHILKFFRGKKQAYTVEETATAIVPDKLYTKPDWENLYVLDKTNSRIVKLDKDGKISTQYYNSEIGNANNFAVDEEANVVYISLDTEIKSFGM